MSTSDLEFLRRENRMRPVRPPQPSVVAYVQGRRIITTGPFPGPYDVHLTPYWIEAMENMGPYSPVQEESWMKGCQIAATTSAENIIAYWMDENPTDILYISSTEELLEEWSTRRLDQLINSMGFAHKIAAQTENRDRKVRRTGDKIMAKEFSGGSIKLTSARSAGNLRSMTRRLIIKDEMDGADADLKTGEGNYSDVADARASAWGPRKKILNLGTPGVWDESLIRKKYEEGDCRLYMVPCPHCGHYQALEMLLTEKPTHGLAAETRAGELVRAYYLCDHCHDAVFEHHKTEMFARGRWEATRKSSSPFVVSRHISSLYSPYGMLSWTEMYRMYLRCRDEPDTQDSGMRSFTTLYLGLPYKQTGSRPDLRTVVTLRGTYRQTVVPDGAIYLTMAVDVQEGTKRDPDHPPRLELEVLGTGDGYRTWGIDRKSFRGDVDDPHAGAWEDFYEWGNETRFQYRTRAGAPLPVDMVFVDSGYKAEVVYQFCFGRGWVGVHPCKGVPQIVADPGRGEKADSRRRFVPYRTLQVGGAAKDILYEVNGQWYKGLLYGKLWNSKRSATEPQPAGFCDFPLDYDDEFFAQLTAEELLTDGTYRKIRVRNEALDIRTYAMCAADVFLALYVDDLRRKAITKGASKVQAEETIRSPYALQVLKARNAENARKALGAGPRAPGA